MQSHWAMVTQIIGIILMAGFGSIITRQMDTAQWQMAGFVIGLLLCILAPVWDLQRRLKKLENEIKKAAVDATR